MPSPVDANLVAGWIALYSSAAGTPEHDEHAWAFGRVWDMCEEDPNAAWRFVLAVLASDRSPKVMKTLAAGPLEELLAQHPHAMIELVEAEARTNPDFARLLGGVWQNAMPDDIWRRVQAAMSDTW